MTDRSQQAKALFQAALDRPASERTVFLDEACAGDEALRQDVTVLLASQGGAGALLEWPAVAGASPALAHETDSGVTATHRLTAGARLGPYEIVGLIGAGGMGEVYRARDRRLRRDVAIKVLPAAVASDPHRLWRFEQEALATASLNHPNILAVYDVGTHDRSPYVVSELLDGHTLRAPLDAGRHVQSEADSSGTGAGRLPVDRVLDYAKQIARGLAAAHAKEIVHRDLKPENLFVTADGRLKILDFGLAKLTGAAEAAATTATGTGAGVILGTVGYMAPEQVRGQPADARSDLFSLGAILYEMLAGRRAFAGASASDTLSAILRDEPRPLTQIDRTRPPALEAIVRRCLAKRPQDRFQSAPELVAALEAVEARPEAASRSWAVASVQARRWARTPVTALVAAAVVAVGISVGSSRAGHSCPRSRPPVSSRCQRRSMALRSSAI